MNNFNLLTNKDIAEKGNTLLNKESKDYIQDLTIDDRLDSLAVLLVYKDMLEERFADTIKALEDSISDQDFSGSLAVGSHKVTFKVKEVINAKAVGLTNEALKTQYNIADAIISVDTKTIATLKKDKLEEAINAQIPEVLDAIRDGKLIFSKDKTKTSSVK